jgi:hypothetical protein
LQHLDECWNRNALPRRASHHYAAFGSALIRHKSVPLIPPPQPSGGEIRIILSPAGHTESAERGPISNNVEGKSDLMFVCQVTEPGERCCPVSLAVFSGADEVKDQFTIYQLDPDLRFPSRC